MTAKRHITIEAADLVALHIECAKCHSYLSIPISKIDRSLPQNCPNCQERWGSFDEGGPYHTMQYVVNVKNAAETLREKMKNAGFILSLELSPGVSTHDA